MLNIYIVKVNSLPLQSMFNSASKYLQSRVEIYATTTQNGIYTVTLNNTQQLDGTKLVLVILCVSTRCMRNQDDVNFSKAQIFWCWLGISRISLKRIFSKTILPGVSIVSFIERETNSTWLLVCIYSTIVKLQGRDFFLLQHCTFWTTQGLILLTIFVQ